MNGVSCVLLVLFTAPAEPDPTALKQWLLWGPYAGMAGLERPRYVRRRPLWRKIEMVRANTLTLLILASAFPTECRGHRSQ